VKNKQIREEEAKIEVKKDLEMEVQRLKSLKEWIKGQESQKQK